MTFDDTRWTLRQTLKLRVGGFFHNVKRSTPGVCDVCAGPATSARCSRCAGHATEFGASLADHVLLLTYVRGRAPQMHQSAHTVLAYKQTPPAEKCAKDMALMVLAATYIHHDCIGAVAGRAWNAVTFVPSARRPGPDHPVAELARQVTPSGVEQRLRLGVGSDPQDGNRDVRSDRFIVPPMYRSRVEGQHVLLVDDTWTSGCKMQSAALALRSAGAATITALCVARWCRDDWPDHRALLDSCTEPYDAMVCPVNGGHCAPETD